MVTRFHTPTLAKAASVGGLVFALILLCLNLAAAGQTAKSSATPAKKAPAKKATEPAKAPTAVIHTTAGDMKCDAFPRQGPQSRGKFCWSGQGHQSPGMIPHRQDGAWQAAV